MFESLKRPYQIRLVLVRPIYERNIGAVSRVMSNMGVDQLILLAPQCELTFESQQAAATGQEGLKNHILYMSWDELNRQEPESLRFAFTARDGKGRTVQSFPTLLNEIREKHPIVSRESDIPFIVHLIFGPEDWGLAADDLEHCHLPSSLPIFGENSSLNLAQATLLASFLLRQHWGGSLKRFEGQQPNRKKESTQNSFFQVDESLKKFLTTMGFDISSKRINAYSVMKRMLLQNYPTQKEYRILETVLQQGARKMQELKDLQKLYSARSSKD